MAEDRRAAAPRSRARAKPDASIRPRKEARGGEDEVLRTAARLFREQGFAGTGLRQIARESGMLLGSLHYRYPTKESLLVALMEEAVLRTTEAVRKAVDGTTDPILRVRAALAAHLRLLLAGDDAVYVLLYDWRVLRGDARDAIVRLRDRYDALWDGMLYQAAGAGLVRPGIDLRLLRLFGLGAVNWVATWYRPSEGSLDADAIADAFYDMFAHGVLAREEPKAKPSRKGRQRGGT